MNWIKIGEVNIHYEWIKSKDPHAEETLILINGAGLDMYSWDFIIPYFLKNYHVMRYDLRGHGYSDEGKEKRDITLLAEDLHYLISKLHIKNCHVIAQGLGGFIGIEIASHNQNKIKSLVLMGVPLHYPKRLGSKIVKYRRQLVEGQNSMLRMGQEVIKTACYPPTKEKNKRLLHAYKKVSPTIYFELFHTGFGEQGIKNLQKLNIQILILSGSEDKVFPPELTSASLNFNPNARFFTVPNAAFMIQMDQPQLTADWIHGFIEKINSKEKSESQQYEQKYQRDLTTEVYSEIRQMLHNNHQQTSSKILQVNLMSGFKVLVNGQPILEGWGKRKAKPLLIYLLFHPSVTRDELCDVLWPDTDIKNARNRLRVSLHHLKKTLEANSKETMSIIQSDREHVYLQCTVESDLLSHLQAIREAHNESYHPEKIKQYKKLLMAMTENPLPGLYEDWFLKLRENIERDWAEMALFLADVYEEQKHFNHAVHSIQLALQYLENEELTKRLHDLKTIES
ncbi:Pimeloyl-ACP methyl ester carboxylesterase [Salinibacillus kushneri]|uniref:Pimeloyl-ACP methyl ester carboxylesterase n=1 Tax=Salinibacillus kushneri TaxID=237682 RepID=A0A1I0CG81_9BACI|nr:alpha/beta hydrolase [Salinibacillus kushneri]SET18151.1 Pimeloyl-ACP methyl ester carboxylesterase [Salinibacillus kushneri]